MFKTAVASVTGAFLLLGCVWLAGDISWRVTGRAEFAWWEGALTAILCWTAAIVGSAATTKALFKRRYSLGKGDLSKRLLVVLPSSETELLMASGFLQAIAASAKGGEHIDLMIESEMMDFLPRELLARSVGTLVYHASWKDGVWGLSAFHRRAATFAKIVGEIQTRGYAASLQLSGSWYHSWATFWGQVPKRTGYYSRGRHPLVTFLRTLLLTESIGYCHTTSKVEFYQGEAKRLGLKQAAGPMVPVVPFSAESRQIVSVLLARNWRAFNDPWYVCVLPGAESVSEQWPYQRFVQVVSTLKTKARVNIPFLFVFRHGEERLKAKVQHLFCAAGCEGIVYLDHIDADDESLVSLCAGSLLTVSNVGVASHVARIVGSWSVTVCGPTSFEYVKYRSRGISSMLYPPKSRPRNMPADDPSTCPTISRPIREVSVARVYSEVEKLINYQILSRKIDRLIRECGGRLPANAQPLREKIAQCMPHIKSAVPLTLDILRQDGLPMDQQVAGLERLAYMYFLLGLHEDPAHNRRMCAQTFSKLAVVKRLQRNAQPIDGVWGVYPLASTEPEEKHAELLESTFEHFCDLAGRTGPAPSQAANPAMAPAAVLKQRPSPVPRTAIPMVGTLIAFDPNDPPWVLGPLGFQTPV